MSLQLDERRARGVHAAIREALNARLLSGDRLDAAGEVLEQLNGRVPGWLQAGPIGEAGYLVAAEAVLRALVDAEDRDRRSLTQTELLRELGDAKPLGSSAGDVLARMRREKFITVNSHNRDEPSISAASAGRRFLHRDTAVADDTWVVRDSNALLDLILYAEHRPGEHGHRPSIQAIGRLDDKELAGLADALIGFDLLKAPDVPLSLATWLELTSKGSALAREPWQQSAPPGVRRYAFDPPPAPPLPLRRRVALRIDRDDRVHPVDPTHGRDWCSPASWLQHSSKTKLFATLKRDGAVQWTCTCCNDTWDRLPASVHRRRRARVHRPGRRHLQPAAMAPGLPLELRVMTPATRLACSTAGRLSLGRAAATILPWRPRLTCASSSTACSAAPADRCPWRPATRSTRL